MILIYFKQAWNLLRQEKLFSSIYIAGTGLSIAVVMVLSIVYYIKIANVYPETNRDRLLIIDKGVAKSKNNMSSGYISYPIVDKYFYSLTSAEAVTAVYDTWQVGEYVQIPGSDKQLPVVTKFIDNNFWIVFPFHFIDGKPFTEADMQSGIRTAVICETLARKVFGRIDVTGEYISLDFIPYKISGVVKDGSYALGRTFAHLWIPYTVVEGYNKPGYHFEAIGNMITYILSPSKSGINKVKQEVEENVRRYVQTLDNVEFNITGQPDTQIQSVLRGDEDETTSFNQIIIRISIIFLLLLLVPAVSLSGMADSRMERRMAEMGVRRAFGSPNGNLMWQIISENFIFTLLGGLAGLVISFLIVIVCKDWILQLGDGYVEIPPDGTEIILTPSMLINLPLFGLTLAVCLILNLLTAMIPAWRASHREIVYSLTTKS